MFSFIHGSNLIIHYPQNIFDLKVTTYLALCVASNAKCSILASS